MDILTTGRRMFHRGAEAALATFSQAKQTAQALEEDLKARREVDVGGMVAGVRARLQELCAPLESLPIDADLADRHGPANLGRVRTSAFRAPRLRKIVLSHVGMSPIVEGLALVLLPTPDQDFPVFAADLMALPHRVSVNVDVYGRDWQTRGVLGGQALTFRRLGNDAGPLWSAKLGSGQGLHAKLKPRMVDQGFAALTQALAAYLEQLKDAPPGRSTESQEAFFDAFHDNGPRKGPLRRVMGEAWAERYSRLVFE